MTDQAPQAPQTPKKSSNKTLVIVLTIVGVLVVLGIVGSIMAGLFAKKVAEKGAESILSKATNGAVDIDTKNNSVTISTGDGTTTIGSQKLPSDFPSDIPVYTDATVLGSVTGTSQDAGGVFVSLNTSDSLTDVKAFYESELPKNGWTNEDTTTLGTIVNIASEKGDKRLSVTITPYENNQVHITLATSSK